MRCVTLVELNGGVVALPAPDSIWCIAYAGGRQARFEHNIPLNQYILGLRCGDAVTVHMVGDRVSNDHVSRQWRIGWVRIPEIETDMDAVPEVSVIRSDAVNEHIVVCQMIADGRNHHQTTIPAWAG